MNYYPNYNQFYQPQYQPQRQIEQPVYQPIKPTGIQGKSVDSLEVVKAMDIPLDGSISYFPLTDGTAIVTKQLQQDGSSKTVIYRPVQEEQKEESVKYITIDELENVLNEVEDLKDELKELRKELKKKNKEV